MKSLTLGLFECTGKQDYIFGSNVLKQNIGASELIMTATTTWVEESVVKIFGNNLAATHLWHSQPGILQINSNDIHAEILYQGGGNSVILFDNEEQANHVLEVWSEIVLRRSPGMHAVAVLVSLKHGLSEALDAAYLKLSTLKVGESPAMRLLGTSITCSCASTGLVATTWDSDKEQWISEEARTKLAYTNKANDRLRSALANYITDKVEFTLDFDKMGGREGEHHIAIVHADGNGMGARFRDAVNRNGLEEAVQSLRCLSISVEKAGIQSLGKVVSAIYAGIKNQKLLTSGISVPSGDTIILPIRPLIYGGDDLTIVCDGRLGLAAAAMYLREFNINAVSDGKSLHACAGVSIAHSKYPFGRAYKIAEEATHNAKLKQKELLSASEIESSWLDFHISLDGISGSLKDIRRRAYQTGDDQSLISRPWSIIPSRSHRELNGYEWQNFVDGIKHFQNKNEWPRNKAKELRDALYNGRLNTKVVLEAAKSRHYKPLVINDIQDGWGERDGHPYTPYFDMLDAIDFYIGLGDNEE